MKTLLLVGLNVLWLACAKAELGAIGALLSATTAAPITASGMYSGEPYGEALYDLVNSGALLVAHELSTASETARTDVFRLSDGRHVAITSRAAKSGAVFGIVNFRITSNAQDKLTRNTPKVDVVDLPGKQAAQAALEAPAPTDVRLKMSSSSSDATGKRTESRELVITGDKPGFVHLWHYEGGKPMVAPLLPSPDGASYCRKVAYDARESGGQFGDAVFTYQFIAGPGEKEQSETVELWNHRHISYDDFAKGLREIQDPTGMCLRAVPLDLAPLGDEAFLIEVTDTPEPPRPPHWALHIWHPTYSCGPTLPRGLATTGAQIGYLITTGGDSHNKVNPPDGQKVGRISQRDGKFIAYLDYTFGSSTTGFSGIITPECPVDFNTRVTFASAVFPVVGVLTQERDMMPFLLKQLRKDLRGRHLEDLLSP